MALVNSVTAAATAYQNAAAALEALATGSNDSGAKAANDTLAQARAALETAINAVELETRQKYAAKR